MAEHHRGQCLCGAVAFEIVGPLSPPTLCHCSMCRRIHGAPGAYTSAPAAAYHMTGAEHIAWYPLSARGTEQGFCRVCGAKLFWRERGGAGLDVTLGSLDQPTGLTLAAHIWVRSRGDYYAIGDDGVPHYAESARGAQPIPAETGALPGGVPQAHTGHCLCGAVRYRVDGNIRDVVVCHCRQCRHLHGHPGGYSAARRSELSIEGEGELVWYRSSEGAARGFCRHCGSSLFWRPEGRDAISITAGSLDAPTGLKTVRHIFAADKGDCYAIADGVPQSPGSMQGDPVAF